MRGLKYMMDGEPDKGRSKQANEEGELVREPFMDKAVGQMSEEEYGKYQEFLKKEKEFLERKEKQKSQNLTKLANLKNDIEQDKIALETKMQKIVKKKMFYDYKIVEQELYVITLLRSCKNRDDLKIISEEFEILQKQAEGKEIEAKQIKKRFLANKENFEHKYTSIIEKVGDKKNRDKINDPKINLIDLGKKWLKKFR
jgi:hypothetical protein